MVKLAKYILKTNCWITSSDIVLQTAGDQVTAEIDRLGEITNTIVAK